MRLHSFFVLSVICSAPILAQEPDERAGDSFRITVFHESRSEGKTGSSSSSGGHEYIEQVVAVSQGGVERIYDVPREADEDLQLTEWQFPVHIFEATNGELEIVNRSDLEARRDAWLAAAEIPSDACGTWYFTWNAFQVECDPDAILETIRTIKIQPERLDDGASFSHPAAIQTGTLQLLANEGSKFHASMSVDADYFHRAEAQSDVIVGKIMKEPVTFEEAFARRKTEQIIGTIEVVLTVSESGRVLRQVTSIETTKIDAHGETEQATSTETIERTKL